MKPTERTEGDRNVRSMLCTVPQDALTPRVPGVTFMNPPMAMVQLIKFMERHGYKGDFYDIDMLVPSEEEIIAHLKQRNPQIVGISAVVSASYFQAKQLARIIRVACPEALIVLGGYMAASANVLLRKTEVDICAIGDGEKTWVKLLDCVSEYGANIPIEKLKQVKGIAFLNEQGEMEVTGYGERIDISDYHQPDYDVLARGLLGRTDLINCYFGTGKGHPWFNHDARTHEPHRKRRLAILIGTKGCVAKCTFCQRFGKPYINFDLEGIERHIIELKEKYDVGFIGVGEETFGLPKKHALEVARILKKHDMLWAATGVRCTSFTADDLKFLYENGCTFIKYGVESGSQTILDVMEKRFKVEDVISALKNAQGVGIYSPLLFCCGMPGESDQTIMESGRLLGQFAATQGVPPADLGAVLFFARAFPGAPLYDYGQILGMIGNTVDEEEKYLTSISAGGAVCDTKYLNLSGTSNRKVKFWVPLFFYEATRAYYSSPDRKENPNYPYPKSEITLRRILLEGAPRLTFRRLVSMLLNPFLFLNQIMQRSALVARIPRFLVYPTMRNLVQLEAFIKTRFLKPMKRFIKDAPSEAVAPEQPKSIWVCNAPVETTQIRHEFRPPKLPKGISLRKINKELRSALPAPTTLTEKNQRFLYSD